MKMSDVFDLPLQRAVNELAIIDKKDLVVGWSDLVSGEEGRDSFVHAVNNHDRLEQENSELRKALEALVASATINEEQLNALLMSGDYGESEALCKARQLLGECKER